MRALMKFTHVEEALQSIEAVIGPFLKVIDPSLSDIRDVFHTLHLPFDPAVAAKAGYEQCLYLCDGVTLPLYIYYLAVKLRCLPST